MSKNIKNGAVIIDRAKLEALLSERTETLAKVEKNLSNFQQAANQASEQVIGLRHRINELTELLK